MIFLTHFSYCLSRAIFGSVICLLCTMFLPFVSSSPSSGGISKRSSTLALACTVTTFSPISSLFASYSIFNFWSLKFDSTIYSATLIFSSIALSLMLDLEEPLLDVDDLLLLDPTYSLFSSGSFNHLMILCSKLNILSTCSSNHWQFARSSSSVNKCWYSSFTTVSSFNMSLNHLLCDCRCISKLI